MGRKRSRENFDKDIVISQTSTMSKFYIIQQYIISYCNRCPDGILSLHSITHVDSTLMVHMSESIWSK